MTIYITMYIREDKITGQNEKRITHADTDKKTAYANMNESNNMWERDDEFAHEYFDIEETELYQ